MHSLAWVARYSYQCLAHVLSAMWRLACIEGRSACPSAGSRKELASLTGALNTDFMMGRPSTGLGLKLRACEACSLKGCFPESCQGIAIDFIVSWWQHCMSQHPQVGLKTSRKCINTVCTCIYFSMAAM